ncbi:serine/threonine protein kinase, partial [Myxococcota bacterium]|nr:serine/threonine protein kinase [Myxococcota bacterium]
MRDPSSPPGSEPSPGRLGRYTLLAPLGEGGMARVFLAQRDGATDVCVLKRLHVALEGHPIALKRFQREAHIASLLHHPAIARVVDAGLERGSFHLALEYVAGETLEAVASRAIARWGAVPLALTLAVASAVLDALAYAHTLTEEGRPLRIVHRDLSPRNVMLTYDGDVKVIDFGIARGDVDELKTEPGVLMGTPYYMSPEQAMTAPVDHRSDLYTIAAVLFELLTGRRLVTASGRAQVLLAVATEPAPPPSSLTTRAPKRLD